MNMEPFANPEWMTAYVWLIYAVYFAILTPIAIATYIVQALSLMRIAKKLDVPNGWMAFIPFASIYLIGKIAEKSDERAYPGREGRKWSKILLGWTIATVAATLVLSVLLTIGVVFAAFTLHSEKTMITVTVVSGVVYTLILMIPAVILSVYDYMAYYRIYRVMAGQKNAVWMLLLSIFVGMAGTVILAVLGFGKNFPRKEDAGQIVSETAN